MKIFLLIVLVIAGLLLLFVVGPSLALFRYIFTRRDLPDPGNTGDERDEAWAYLSALPRQEAEITAPDGVRLWAEYIPNHSGRAALFMHGFRSAPRYNFALQARLLYDRGFSLLLPAQRGHGKSGGKYTSFGMREQSDILLWQDWLRDKADQVLIYGTSMGAAAIGFAADRLDPDLVKAMVLDCGFTCPRREFAQMGRLMRFPWPLMYPVFWLCARVRLGLDMGATTETHLAHTRVPALFLHGEKDEVVLPEESEKAYAACASPKELCLVPDAIHTAAYMRGGEKTVRALERLIEQYFTVKGESV